MSVRDVSGRAKQQPTPEELDTPVIFNMGYYVNILMPMHAAALLMNTLGKENLQKAESQYIDGKSVETLKPWGTEDISIKLISPAEVLLRQAAYQRIEAEKEKK